MNFPRFWAKGSYEGFSSWRWSARSLAEAQRLAQEAARNLAERFAAQDLPPRRYAYGDRPLREPVLREVENDSGELAAVITRNSYGCLVLNTARVLFLDVDLPSPFSGGWLRRLLGKADVPAPEQAQATTLAKAKAWAERHAPWGWRAYRTRAGLRFVATHDLFEAASVAGAPVFDELGVDPLNRRLCKSQESFRARLTPKPWRCGVGLPPARWPWEDASAEESFEEWEKRYARACADKATCKLLSTIGDPRVHPEVRVVVDIHDEQTRAKSELPLA